MAKHTMTERDMPRNKVDNSFFIFMIKVINFLISDFIWKWNDLNDWTILHYIITTMHFYGALLELPRI